MRNLILISAPSGSGKTTLCRALEKRLEDLSFSVSCTTRPPRRTEREGVDYYFISPREFERRLARGDFAEHEEVHGHYYGTLKSTLDRALENGQRLLLEVDVHGAMALRELYPADTLSIFIHPPSVEDLRRRLAGRGTDSQIGIARRLERLEQELSFSQRFDYQLTNDDLERAVEELITIINQDEGVLHGT